MQIIDPLVSRKKFEDEISLFRQTEDLQRSRGIALLKANFPDAFFQFAAPQLAPPVILFTVKFNFDNYDLQPISVRFVNHFTLQNLEQVLHSMPRIVARQDGTTEMQHMIQKEPTGLPFLCIPGTREYHEHPAHTGDDWLLHRDKAGEGCLGFLIDKIHQFGTTVVTHYQLLAQAPSIGLALDQSKMAS